MSARPRTQETAANDRGRRATAGLLAASLVVTLFTSTFGVPMAAAADPLPAADLLEVDFATGSAADTSASGRATITSGAPVHETDPVLDRSVATFNRHWGGGNASTGAGALTADAYGYNLADAWNAPAGGEGSLVDGFTLECVFKLNQNTPVSPESDVCGSKNGGGFGLWVGGDTAPGNSNLTFTVHNGSYQVVSTPIVAGTWYDAVLVYHGDGTGSFDAYLNGARVGTKTFTGNITVLSNKFLELGASPGANGSVSYRGNVSLAAGQLWSTPLTEEQVAELNLTTGVTDDLPAQEITPISYPAVDSPELADGVDWPASVPKPNMMDVNFANGNTANTVDGSAPTVARANTGGTQSPTSPSPAIPNPNDGPVLVTSEGLAPEQTVAQLNAASAFAYPAKVFGPNSPTMRDGGTVSWECVFRVTAESNHSQSPCGAYYAGGLGLVVSANPTLANGGTLVGQLHVNGGYSQVSAPIQLNTWYDAVLTYDGHKQRLYLNGELLGVASPEGPITVPTHRFFGIGGTISNATATQTNTNPYSTFGGQVAASRVWTSTLTKAEVGELHTISGVQAVDPGEEPAEVTVPAADVLDIDFQNNSFTDRAAGRTPVVVAGKAPYDDGLGPVFGFDDALQRPFASFNGDTARTGANNVNNTWDTVAYDLNDAWNPSLTPNIINQVTIECWFRYNGTLLTSGGHENDICSGKESGGYAIYIPTNTSRVGAMFYVNGAYYNVQAPITANTWQHDVATFDGRALRLYVNGDLKTSSAVRGLVGPPTGGNFNIGADTGSTLGSGQTGAPVSLTAVRVWGTALSEEQVGKLYARDTEIIEVPPADLLDVDFAGAEFGDHSPTANAHEVFGTPQIVTDPTLGRPVGVFDGDASVIYDITHLWEDTAEHPLGQGASFECNFRYDGEYPTVGEHDVCSGKHTGGYSFYVNGTSVGMMLYDGTAYKRVTTPFQPGVWNHLVFTYDRAMMRLYLNGKLVARGPLTAEVPAANYGGAVSEDGSPIASKHSEWGVGSDINAIGGPETGVKAAISEARIYSAILSADQVKALYAKNFGVVATDIRLESSQPAAGSHLTSPVELRASIHNRDQAIGWSYTIDGDSVQPGARVGAGLSAGDHTLAIVGTDTFGRTVEFTVPFTSEDIPLPSGVTSGKGEKGTVSLSALAQGAAGEQVTTTFHVAAASLAEGGETGAVVGTPSTLDFAAQQTAELSGIQIFGDGQESASASAHNLLPYQKFDVPVPAGEVRRVRWSGTVDPDRVVTLYAWNVATNAWEPVGGVRGNSVGSTTVDAEVAQAHVDTGPQVAEPNVGVVHLLALATDPFYDELSSRDGSNANEGFGGSETQNPDSYESKQDFSFIHWTDPQFLAEGATGGSGNWVGPAYGALTNGGDASQDEAKVWAEAYKSALRWTAQNAEKKKVVYSAATGDMINTNVIDTDSASRIAQFGLSSQYTSRNGVPKDFSRAEDQVHAENTFINSAFSSELWSQQETGYSFANQVIAGNHDNNNGIDSGTSASWGAEEPTLNHFSDTFPAQAYYDQAESWPAGAEYHTQFEEVDADGKVVAQAYDNQNNYVLFSGGGQEFVAVGLSYGVTTAEAEWASSIFAKYPDRNGILITHGYLGASSSGDGRGAGFSSDGARLYSRVVQANPNVFLVLAGHVHGVGTNIKSVKSVETATVTHKTVELLADYQDYQVTAGRVFGAEQCRAAGLAEVYDAETNPTGTRCKVIDGRVDVDGDGVGDHLVDTKLYLGASFLRLLEFDVEHSSMTVHSYSPFLDEYGAHEYDAARRYNGSEDAFTLPVNLMTRSTSFTTDGLAVLTPTEEVIGTAMAASGFPATVTWDGLTAGETYAWTATSTGRGSGSASQFGGLVTPTAAELDKVAPVITLSSAAVARITVGDAFDPRAGVSATDNFDGDVEVEVIGTVDISTPGDYSLVYAAVDSNGNQAYAARVVRVEEAAAPEPTPVKVSVPTTTVTFLKTATFSGSVSPANAKGSVTFYFGEDEICTGEVVNQTVRCTTDSHRAAPGTYVARAVFWPAKGSGFASAESSFVLKVVEATPEPTTPKKFTGVAEPSIAVPKAGAKVGQKLTVKLRASSPVVTPTLQWLRDGRPIAAATGKSYTLVKADAGHKVSVRATWAKSGYTTVVKLSAAKSVAKYVATVKLSGPTSVKRNKAGKLTVAVGAATANPTGTVTVTITRGGKAVRGVKAITRTVAAKHNGKVTVTLPKLATKGSYRVTVVFRPSGGTARTTASSVSVHRTLRVK